MDSDQVDAMSIGEFARRHGFSKSYVYQLLNDGRGPRTMKVGRRRVVSREAAAEWRRRMERGSAA